MKIKIYTDGACSGNPGIGGWGVVIIFDINKKIYLNGGLKNTTNNQMELIAAIEALKKIDNKNEIINFYTDSKYVKDGIESWIINWKKNGWKTASKKEVKNKELWIQLDKQILNHKINWHWIKGHSGNTYNEEADSLARKYIENN